MIWRSSHWKLLPRGISHIPARFRIWLHVTNTLTFHAANVIRTATEATTKTTLWETSDGLHSTWTDHCLFATVEAFRSQLHPYNTALESRRLDERNPDKSKDTWLISDRYTIMPSIDRFFPHFKRLLRRRNTSTGHSLEFPSTRVIEWDRGFYTSREMTVHVRFSFRLPGIIILTFRWPTNTK